MKMSGIRRCFCAAAVLVLGACVAPENQDETAEPVVAEPVVETVAAVSDLPSPIVQRNFLGSQFNWGNSAGLLMRYQAIEHNGEVLICGAFASKGTGDLRRLSREALRQATVTSNGSVIMRDVRFFAQTSNANWGEDLIGVETNCRSTGKSVGEAPFGTIFIQMREGRYRIRT